MTYTIKTTKSVEDVIRKWKKSNPKLFKKYEKIYLELSEHPRTGIGHPEPLVGGDSTVTATPNANTFWVVETRLQFKI